MKNNIVYNLTNKDLVRVTQNFDGFGLRSFSTVRIGPGEGVCPDTYPDIATRMILINASEGHYE